MSLSILLRATFAGFHPHVDCTSVTPVTKVAYLNVIQVDSPALNDSHIVDRTTAYYFLPNRHSSRYRPLGVCRRAITPEVPRSFPTSCHTASHKGFGK
jgi:hypothetical protein